MLFFVVGFCLMPAGIVTATSLLWQLKKSASHYFFCHASLATFPKRRLMQLLVEISSGAVGYGAENLFLFSRLFASESNNYQTYPIYTQPTLPVPEEAPLWLRCKRSEQTKLCAAYFVSGQSSAGAGTQPSGYERSGSKKYKWLW